MLPSGLHFSNVSSPQLGRRVVFPEIHKQEVAGDTSGFRDIYLGWACRIYPTPATTTKHSSGYHGEKYFPIKMRQVLTQFARHAAGHLTCVG